ncbi:TPA: FAD-dependent thymidylate synthase [Candidatus Acetothermia bacterium]|nr:FAD-dependent thymidylate synthase [Candidatus Acetothermia bacterium]
MQITVVDITENPLVLIAKAARVSHRSEESNLSSDKELVQKLVNWGHFSVLEAATATFLIEGISRACTHQLVRHRHLSFVQESLRYVGPMGDHIIPPSVAASPPYNVKMKELADNALALYQEMVASGIPKEDARFILPIGTPTRIMVAGNFRAWREVIEKRGLNPHAQWEIKELLNEILTFLVAAAPVVFQDLADSTRIR